MHVFYQKTEDEFVLSEIKEVLKARASYGYRRITAIINRKRKLEFKSRINKKRVLRVMQINGLTLQRTSSPRDHKPTGKVMTLFSNTRWCSDAFEIRCFDRTKVFVAFVLDCHDREAISFVARKEPLTQIDIQSLMVMSVEKRFSSLHAPREIQWLSDRGSIYRATETILTAKSLNLKSCFTSSYSPESNGMAESFVKTIKRDYVYQNDCADQKTVLRMLAEWFEDYNQSHPHSALGMQSPKEYLEQINRV